VNLALPVPLLVLLFHVFQKRKLGIREMALFMSLISSLSPTISKSTERNKTTNLNQWPDLILSSSTTGLWEEEALIPITLSLSIRGALFKSIAVSTIECQCSQEAAFFHAQEGPMFSNLISDSIALSHVYFGLPGGRFQSDGGL